MYRSTALSLMLLLAVTALVACGDGDDPSSTSSLVRVSSNAALKSAGKDVAEGGLILIEPGVYEEKLLVTKPDVTIRGTDRNAVIIDGGAVRPYGVAATADGVRVENLTVRNTVFYGVLVTGLSTDDGPVANGADGYTTLDPSDNPPVQRFGIDHVTAYNNGLYGIYAFNAQHGSITDSYASGSADSGFYVGQCEECDISVTGNVAERNAIGFENANASDSLRIVGNRFSNNRVGMTLISNYQEAFVPQRGNVVSGNLVADNAESNSPRQAEGGFGVGVGLSGARNNLFTFNRITGNPAAGVALASAEDLPTGGNVFVDNAYADNGVDAWNRATSRSPSVDNCLDAKSLEPARFTAPCAPTTDTTAAPTGDLSDEAQPAAPEYNVPASPPGRSFLKIPAPPKQPQWPGELEKVGEPLPETVTSAPLPTSLPAVSLFDQRVGVR